MVLFFFIPQFTFPTFKPISTTGRPPFVYFLVLLYLLYTNIHIPPLSLSLSIYSRCLFSFYFFFIILGQIQLKSSTKKKTIICVYCTHDKTKKMLLWGLRVGHGEHRRVGAREGEVQDNHRRFGPDFLRTLGILENIRSTTLLLCSLLLLLLLLSTLGWMILSTRKLYIFLSLNLLLSALLLLLLLLFTPSLCAFVLRFALFSVTFLNYFSTPL